MSPVQRGDSRDATPSSRPGEPEGASFGGRIDRRRGGPPMFVLAFGLVLGGMVAIAIAGRPTAGPGAVPTQLAAASPTGGAISTAPSDSPPTPSRPSSRPSPGRAPIVGSEAGGPVMLQLRRHPETLFVHGDVFVVGVTWVFVALIDDTGRVAGWTSVSVPGGAGATQGDRPTLRFDVELAMPDWATERLWVQATAYDGTGAVVGTERLGIGPDGGPVLESPPPVGGMITPAARPGVFFPLLDTTWAERRAAAALAVASSER